MTIRLANIYDASELQKLNVLFNGEEGCNEADSIKKFLENNNQEIICVAVDKERLAGFCCGQIFKSMCYKDYHGEITELFILDEYRRQHIAKRLTEFMELAFFERGVKNIRVLTGGDNIVAQYFYRSCQYEETDEIMLEKIINKFALKGRGY
jgi:ribosomal protein S18 acetylase RimI-like enzyme